MSHYLLGVVFLLFICLLFFGIKEGYMDSDVGSIQNDLIQQKTILDKQATSMKNLLEKDPDEVFDMDPILKKIVQKIQTLDNDKKEENIVLTKQLKELRQKLQSFPDLIKQYRAEVKKFSNLKLNEGMTVQEFLPSSQKFLETIKKDIEKILKD